MHICIGKYIHLHVEMKLFIKVKNQINTNTVSNGNLSSKLQALNGFLLHIFTFINKHVLWQMMVNRIK